ncbi:MerR family transcriptional regulator [Treponema phagedenis]|uniref:MerR family transcriptional regulator n=1 Tax=Treponema phagedenis TaxID=162 RepID=A0A0B7GVA9_TREPH|nr:MerR family transcriptional regulator [Treponema phagedenis]EFW37990.1 transcriptional regulator, MerR family [Treponema phagedenis F0421]NVP24614.1 MerR family transcriptional regulator [Treponema phagedenis]QEJ94694.1 MerR family transcriptional regulator [Treponema phagedenis]QEJ97630.1 MerR family transcriptional regulator [Treponema phagedenis]QEK00598.1 MerR family transcriptional regulator [Treponema phagedenis]
MALLFIGEVEKLTGIKAHVLRYWETVLPFMKPQKDLQGRRTYTQRDIDLIFRIKYLTEEKNMPLEAAGEQLLNELSSKGGSSESVRVSQMRDELVKIYKTVQDTQDKIK